MRYLHWAVVAVLFWAAWIVFRLGTAVDIQNEWWFWLGIPVGFAFPAFVGYEIAQWRCARRIYHLTCEKEEV